MGGPDAGDDVDESFVDVVERGTVAVVVDVDLDQSLWVQPQPTEDGEQKGLLSDRRVSHFEDGKEDLVQENFNLFLRDPRGDRKGQADVSMVCKRKLASHAEIVWNAPSVWCACRSRLARKSHKTAQTRSGQD